MPKSIDSRHSIDSCIFQLHSWKPFKPHHNTSTSKILDASDPVSSRSSYHYSSNGVYSKRPCLSDRATSFSIDAVDMSKLSLMDEYRPISINRRNGGSYKLFARKRRRKGSRSVSGRSSDRSGTRRCCSIGASATYGTCSDIPVAVGTDSSGELFVIGNMNWGLDVSDGKNSRTTRRDKDGESGVKENLGSGLGSMGGFETQGNESGYGSEPGYRGDAEFGYDDDFDEEEEDARLLFWGHELRDNDSLTEKVGKNTFTDQKFHHRCRRKKNESRIIDSMRTQEPISESIQTALFELPRVQSGKAPIRVQALVPFTLHFT